VRDSLLLYNIYKRYLNVTNDLITILERRYESKSTSHEIKKKHEEFRLHTHNLIEGLNKDLHKLLRIDMEVKNLEKEERKEN